MLLFLVGRDRCGEDTNQTVLHSVINSLVDVEQYRQKDQVQVCIQIPLQGSNIAIIHVHARRLHMY